MLRLFRVRLLAVLAMAFLAQGVLGGAACAWAAVTDVAAAPAAEHDGAHAHHAAHDAEGPGAGGSSADVVDDDRQGREEGHGRFACATAAGCVSATIPARALAAAATLPIDEATIVARSDETPPSAGLAPEPPPPRG